jgi:hypothetical protein
LATNSSNKHKYNEHIMAAIRYNNNQEATRKNNMKYPVGSMAAS